MERVAALGDAAVLKRVLRNDTQHADADADATLGLSLVDMADYVRGKYGFIRGTFASLARDRSRGSGLRAVATTCCEVQLSQDEYGCFKTTPDATTITFVPTAAAGKLLEASAHAKERLMQRVAAGWLATWSTPTTLDTDCNAKGTYVSCSSASEKHAWGFAVAEVSRAGAAAGMWLQPCEHADERCGVQFEATANVTASDRYVPTSPLALPTLGDVNDDVMHHVFHCCLRPYTAVLAMAVVNTAKQMYDVRLLLRHGDSLVTLTFQLPPLVCVPPRRRQ